MSEESPKPESLPETDLSPLRSLITELHEVYQELRHVGFTETVATGIVGQMLSDALVYRDDGSQLPEEFNDIDDDESDDNNERGLR